MCVCLHRDTDIDSDRSDKAPREERKQKDNKKKKHVQDLLVMGCN